MTLFLLDANSLIHRCFYALPPLKNKSSKATGALYGLANILLKILKEQKPDFIAAFFDRPEPTFRKKLYQEYKIHRKKAPDDLKEQIIEAHNLFNAFSIKTFEIPGFEADDLIGTAVKNFKNVNNLKIIIFTGDLDTLQLIKNEKIIVKTFKKGISETFDWTEKEVKEKYGLSPNQFVDFKALVGDPSDNIPGLQGIGPKTAAQILKKYKNIKNFLKKGSSEKIYQKIKDNLEKLELSKTLSLIKEDAPLKINLDDLKVKKLAELETNLKKYFKELGFDSLIKRLEKNSSEPKEEKQIQSLF